MEQGTQEWLEWRRERIGASDAPIIMGISPWTTPYQLWEQKTKGIEVQENDFMRKGKELEPIARKLFIETTLYDVTPACVVSKDYPWMIASLDGRSVTGDTIVEIKCGGEALFKDACNNIIPEYYMAQIQHQIAVCDPIRAYYFVYWEGRGIGIEVKRDQGLIEDIIEKEKEFYRCMVEREPPTLSDRDYVLVEHERGSQLLREYQSLVGQEKAIKERKDSIKAELVEIGPQSNFILDSVKIYQTQSSSYDMQRMRADGIDVDSYKKPSKAYWAISSPRLSSIGS